MTIKAFLIESNTEDEMLSPKRYFQTEYSPQNLRTRWKKRPEEKAEKIIPP